VKSPHALADAERRAWVRLARAPNVGPTTFAALIDRYGSPTGALADLPRLMRRGGSEPRPLPSDDDAAREIEALAKLGGRFVASIEPDFPRGLAVLEAPPPIVSVLGNLSLLAREMVAIVGARNASALGRKLAAVLAQDLSASGLVVVSGMARGIDAAAHEGALGAGTCAVVAGGVDYIYPPENKALYERLREEAVIVSEMPVGLIPQARHFPRRNRIISGLARGVIVVEAGEGSGSLITANYALEQSREIFAVPGSPLDPRAKGANRLIREGATLTETAEDVLTVLRPIIGRDFREPEGQVFHVGGMSLDDTEADRLRALLEEALGPAPVEVDELVRQSGAEAGAVLTVLLELELAGRVTRHPGNRVSWR
jgi:DNA processing protein